MQTPKIVPFKEFIRDLQTVHHEYFVKVSQTKNKSVTRFEEMREHLLNYYNHLDVKHSFTDPDGQVWDCIPIDQQPSLKKSGKPIAQPVSIPGPKKNKLENDQPQSFLTKGLIDDEGNAVNCPKGYVPLRRITLNEITRFETLNDFFRKAPGKKRYKTVDDLLVQQLEEQSIHKYAHAYQIIDNIGGHSFINIWQPKISDDQVFSLCQHWYTAGPYDQIQTVEAGWQVFPKKYSSLKPCLFIYWTADGYNNTGSYNNEDHKFVQTNESWALGGPLPETSATGGEQAEIEIAWYLNDGNWWLYINGTTIENAVGYYPTSLYGNGPMKDFATEIDYGGEVVGSASWPQMGSGQFAATGYQQAAYQRNIFYYTSDGRNPDAELSPSQESSNCFTISTGESPQWNSFFYFGGPGGNNCEPVQL
jgi:Neprosin/Neprosin activation peptide